MQGLLTEKSDRNLDQDMAPSQEPKGDPQTVKSMVQLIYGDHFEPVKKAISSGGKEGLITQVPMVINLILKKVEKDAGQPLDIKVATSSMLQVLQMVLTDAVESGAQPQIDMNTLTTILKNTIAMYLKSHADIIPEETKAEFQQLTQRVSGLKGRGRPSFLREGGDSPSVEEKSESEVAE